SGLDGRGGAFKMAIRQVAGRWYLYMGHEWHRGWTIIDVTDATNPKFVKFVEGPDNTNTIQMELHDNLMLTALQRKQPNWGGDPKSDAAFHGPAIISDDGKTAHVGYGPAVVILDINDISKPKPIGQLTISPPFGAIPAHDVLPIPGKNLLFVHGEMTGEGDL